MAQWSRADRTIYTKIVYYGPAFGGKTTNLECLHRITDPHQQHKLLTVKTADDRTLFFDLLPFDLGDILGYKVAMKLYTVPGQVRYDATRQVVLAGADTVVFVADSSAEREEQNRWSLQNLRINMRHKGLDPARTPLIFQFNKQDLSNAAPPDQVARWLRAEAEPQFPAVAIEGFGVLETFIAASRAMLEHIVGLADERTRKEIDVAELSRQVDRAFEPYLARGRADAGAAPAPAGDGNAPTTIRCNDDDLLQNSIKTSVELGEKLAAESSRASRLDREAEAFRRLSDSLRTMGGSYNRNDIVDAALATAAEVLEAQAVSLVHQPVAGEPLLERAWGRLRDPLLAFEEGRRLLVRMVASSRPCVVNDLSAECAGFEASRCLQGLRAVVAVPLGSGQARALLVYAPQPDGSFRQQDVRFLDTLAGHLALGLEKARLHEEQARQRDKLEELVGSRTEQLREAYEELRGLDRMKERFLVNLSHETRSPLTAILSSAIFLRDYKTNAKQREEMVASIVMAGEKLQGVLEDLYRMVGQKGETEPLRVANTTVEDLAGRAIGLAGHGEVPFEIEDDPGDLRLDPEKVAQAVANLIDNAIKFSPANRPVKLVFRPMPVPRGPRQVEGLAISVLDRGPGVPLEDRERIFGAFEQGGDLMTAKPSGLGIGLHEAATIAAQHGGGIEYIPREGGGSEFRLLVPIHPVHESARREMAHV